MHESKLLTKRNKRYFQRRLLEWFEKNIRKFPWRNTRNPYYVLIAEKLLQQTIARDHVVEAYKEITQNYPEPKDLSNASLKDLRNIFSPLGLIYRAKELKTLATEISTKHRGKVPSNLKDLLSLSGVGDYSSRAVLCFAYGEDVPIVDTNVARFLYRIYGIKNKFPANPARNKDLTKMANGLLPKGQSREFNFAILDLCALICVPINPNCSICPVNKYCLFAQGQ